MPRVALFWLFLVIVEKLTSPPTCHVSFPHLCKMGGLECYLLHKREDVMNVQSSDCIGNSRCSEIIVC